jgi:hypothetical protein
VKIKEILSEHGSDFYATYECEHCGEITPKQSGYHDNYFHTKVIPGMVCKTCGKDRSGNIGISRVKEIEEE